MHFENLANELLLSIFEYLSVIDLLRSFTHLNEHFNRLLKNHFQSASTALDCRSISLKDFYTLLSDYLPEYVSDFQSIRLSNDDDTPQAINLFLQHGFTFHRFVRLKHLSICDLCSEPLMNSILDQWSSLINVTHLTLAGSYFNSTRIDQQRLIDAIWTLPNLTYCYLHVFFFNDNDAFPLPTVESLSIKSLFLWGNSFSVEKIFDFFIQTPQLERCSFIIDMETSTSSSLRQEKSSSVKHLSLYVCSIDEQILEQLFSTMLNLESLKIDYDHSSDDSSTIFYGHQWERLIRLYLPSLQRFHLAMRFISSVTTIHHLIETFRSSFWINEHRWFIRCHWNPFDSLSMVYLHTSSVFGHSYHNRSDFVIESTDPNETHPIVFPMISPVSLVIQSPLGHDFHSMRLKFDTITNLTLSLDDFIIDLDELQFVINRISHLRTFSLEHGKINEKFFSLLQMRVKPFNQLNLRLINDYFDENQCRIVCRSPVAQQCQSLFIKIQNSNNLQEILQSMPHLHALNVECEHHDQIFDWCRTHLSSMYLISRSCLFPDDIHIWICCDNKN